MQAAALATGQKHGNNALFVEIHGHSSFEFIGFLKLVWRDTTRLGVVNTCQPIPEEDRPPPKMGYMIPRITYHIFDFSERDILSKKRIRFSSILNN
jgi:hypothetical protein